MSDIRTISNRGSNDTMKAAALHGQQRAVQLSSSSVNHSMTWRQQFVEKDKSRNGLVDLGVHQDALIHVSQLSDQFVSDPNELVSVGDLVKVKVIEVDVDRKRISVTRKF